MPGETAVTAEVRLQKLELLLNGLSELGAANEPLVDQAYTLALEDISSPEYLKQLAEALRKKWLSEPDFPSVAVRICTKLSDLRVDDVRFRSIIYGHIMNDYRDRAQLRHISRNLFCNSIRFAFEFFRVFHVLAKGENTIRRQKPQRQRTNNYQLNGTHFGSRSSVGASRTTVRSQDGQEGAREDGSSIGAHSRREHAPLPHLNTLGEDDHIYVGFIEPMFEYLQMLIDDVASESEISLFHYLMFLLGFYLERRKPARMLSMIIDVRKKVIDGDMRPSTKALMMELIELHSHGWKAQALPAAVTGLYFKYRPGPYTLGVAMNEPQDDNGVDDDSDG